MATFTQLYSSQLYQADGLTATTGWCGYILNPAGGKEPPASGVTLETLFSTQFPYGIFVFSPLAPNVTDTDSANAFANSVIDYLAGKYGSGGTLTNYAMIWLQNTVSITDSTAVSLTLSYTTFFGVVSPLSFSPSLNISVAIQTNTPCSLDGDLFHFFNTDETRPTMSMNSQFGTIYKNPVSDIYVPVGGPLTGCLEFDLEVVSQNFNFPASIAAIRYFYPDGDTTASFDYSVFNGNQSSTAGSYTISIDPNNILNSGGLLRTYYIPATAAGTPTDIPSGFSTDSGLQLGLSSVVVLQAYPGTTAFSYPESPCGMLIYLNNQGSGVSGNDYDLVPSGQFSLSLWDESIPSDAPNLLAGLSGIETFSFQPEKDSYTGDVLNFIPGQAAYAKLYVPPSGGTSQSGAADLDNTYTTSWINIKNGSGSTTGNNYFSQPTGASLYAPSQGIGQDEKSLLGFFEPIACVLSASNTVVFPMAPYRLLNPTTPTSANDYSDFELKVLATNRKNALEPTIQSNAKQMRLAKTKPTPQPTPTSPVYSTSPQGLLVQVDTTSNTWDQLILASNTDINKTGNPPITMEFLNLNSSLQSAFQTNQQFLVMSWNKPLPNDPSVNILYGEDGNSSNFLNEMMIEGWPFIANVPTSDPNGVFTNVMLYKFCDGKLIDRVNDTSTWTSPELFNSTVNGNLQLLQAWISDYFASAIAKYEAGDMNYYYFATIVQDPNWNGILLLQCDISIQDFPPELQGLLAGIDLSRFYGHHFGINVNHVKANEDGTLAMNPVSSLFGLIDYTDSVFEMYDNDIQEYLENVSPPSGDYNYKVLTLKVLFGNSVIQNFNSYVQLAINKLFGSTVQANNNENIIIFTGAYEDQNGDPNYVFNETGDNMLPLDSNVLNGIEIVKASFVTEEPQNGVDSTMVNVRFSFWGFMNFAEQTFDLYSFGSPESENGDQQFLNGQGLSYSNMAINMSFALETSSVQIFTFDVSQMSFDMGQSNWRDKSLYGHFPLQLTGILTGDTASQPSSQGYVPLPIPGMAGGSTWAGTWYGLVFNLNMGTMGDLANSLGFNSTLMMVWTAGSYGQTGAMLQLPGLSTQAKTLSLQGVLNLNIGNLQLQAAQNQEGGNPVAYLLSMNQITLKFLSFSFPPSGRVDFYLFGDPDANSQPSSLGWYLGYQSTK